MFLHFLGWFENITFKVKTAVSTDLGTFWKILTTFLFLHLVTLHYIYKPLCGEFIKREF